MTDNSVSEDIRFDLCHSYTYFESFELQANEENINVNSYVTLMVKFLGSLLAGDQRDFNNTGGVNFIIVNICKS